MKKLVLISALAVLAAPAFSATATDPLFMLPKGGMMLDSGLAYSKNCSGGDGAKCIGLLETFSYGISDVVEVYGSLGLAHFKFDDYKETGLTDPEFGVKWRAADNIGDDMVLDLSAYVGPSVFDSPFDKKPDGVAKGGTDFGVSALLGRQIDNISWAGYMGIDFIGSTDATDSATDLGFGGIGKYYIDDLNSLDAGISLNFYDKRFSGDDSDMSLALEGGYSRVLTDNLDLSAMLGIATHDGDGLKTETSIGARLRYRF